MRACKTQHSLTRIIKKSFKRLFYTRSYCSCATSKLGELEERLRQTVVCPIDETDWRIAAHFLVCMMGIDCLYPLLTLVLIMRGRIRRCYHRIRPPKKRTDEDIQQTWEKSCRRCCECSSLLTCYLCGGHKLTAQSYGDVAYALTDFLAGEENLDIVPSDGKINRLSFLFVTWRRGMGIVLSGASARQ